MASVAAARGSAVVAPLAQSLRDTWIFLDQGSRLCPLHWQASSRPLQRQGSLTSPSGTLDIFQQQAFPSEMEISDPSLDVSETLGINR